MTKTKLGSFYFHPIPVAIYPILFFYSFNQSQIRPGLMMVPLALAVGLALLIWLIQWLVFRSGDKAALFTSFLLVIIFSYGHLASSMKNIHISVGESLVLGEDKLLMPPVVVMAGIVLYFFWKTKRNLRGLNHYLNLLAVILVLFQLFSIYFKERELNRTFDTGQIKVTDQAEDATPNIYYIVLDSYARQDILKERYGYDNSDFIDFLRKTGFVVIDDARSNYAHTFLSLSSSLNMKHVDYFQKTLGAESEDVSQPHLLIRQNEVARLLKERGYKVINLASGWGPTDYMEIADENYTDPRVINLFGKSVSLSEFHYVLLKTTIFSPLVKNSLAYMARAKILYAFEALPEIALKQGKFFVVAHFNLPHPPYLFDQDGKQISPKDMDMTADLFADKEGYLGQLRYASGKILETVEKIIANSSVPPIIILQSDHGPASIMGQPYGWPRPAPFDGIKERMSILNAYYFPGQAKAIYPTITPVNSFRVLFNAYFNTNFELKPETNFFSDYHKFYEFFDVTSSLVD